jgi:uncharacterized protein YuzE
MRACDEMSYDSEADALYIQLACSWSSTKVRTLMAPGDVNVDVVNGKPVGIEILGVSKHPVFRRLLPDTSGIVELRSFHTGGTH